MGNSTYVRLLGYNIFSGEPCYFIDGFRGVVNTINPHSYIVGRKDRQFRDALNEGDILIADGVGITIAAKVLKGRGIERIPGSDLHDAMISDLNRKKSSCFYLGSSDDTLGKIKKRLRRDCPDIRAGFFSPPFKTVFSKEEDESIIKIINEFDPEVLFVGMTAPKQEKWVHANRHLLQARVICCIGAVFDFYGGTKRRPGKFWINSGLEWLPRFLMEPGRLWKRNLVSMPLFIWYVLVERVRLIPGRRKYREE
jgi:N-acetylglucosaminyldiphosphoundecaprenol N-acetyl-beta-D-mannosaminyltransferase